MKAVEVFDLPKSDLMKKIPFVIFLKNNFLEFCIVLATLN
jgi:hypothetical protein